MIFLFCIAPSTVSKMELVQPTTPSWTKPFLKPKFIVRFKNRTKNCKNLEKKNLKENEKFKENEFRACYAKYPILRNAS